MLHRAPWPLAQAVLGIEKPVPPMGTAMSDIAEVDAEGRKTDPHIAGVDAGGRETDPPHRKTDVDIPFSMLDIEKQIPDVTKTTTAAR